MYKLVTTKRAQFQLKKLPFIYRERIIVFLRELTEDLSLGKRLNRELISYNTLRISPYRAIYKVFPKEKIIKVYKIDHRETVYN